LSGRDANEPQNQEQQNSFHNQFLEGDYAPLSGHCKPYLEALP
jgi:hypothetical protein